MYISSPTFINFQGNIHPILSFRTLRLLGTQEYTVCAHCNFGSCPPIIKLPHQNEGYDVKSTLLHVLNGFIDLPSR